jgi:prepilin-type N-terminal cleavage/methylation domain-containing protein
MLSHCRRQGFTLLEMMVATGMSLIVSGAVYQLLVTTQRLARAQTEHLALQSTVRNAVLIVLNELRELSTSEGQGRERNDLLSGTPTSMTYRASRGVGLTCQPPTSTQIRLAQSGFVAARDPQPGRDSAYVFVEGDANTDTDDTWQPFAITAVSNLSNCAGTLEPGLTLTVSPIGSLVGLTAGTPVRIYEVMELRLYRSEGKSWLGMRSVSAGEAIQPLAGPLSDDGFRLGYLDRAGHATEDVTAVSRIAVTVHGIGGRQPSLNGAAGDSLAEELVTEIALRNSVR